MEFRLPQELQNHLFVSTTPRSKLKQEEESEDKPKAQRLTLGAIPNIFPEGLVEDELFNDVVRQINLAPRAQRHHIFRRDKEDGSTETYAILYHYNHVWMAAWFPEDPEEYLYGYSVIFKNTNATFERSKLSLNKYLNPVTDYGCGVYNYAIDHAVSTFKVVRTEYYRCTRIVTCDDILNLKFMPTQIDSYSKERHPGIEESWLPVFGKLNECMYSSLHRYEPTDSDRLFVVGYSYPINSGSWSNMRSYFSSTLNAFESTLCQRVNAIQNTLVFDRMCTPNVLAIASPPGAYRSFFNYGDPIFTVPDQPLNYALIKEKAPTTYRSSVAEAFKRVEWILDTPFFSKKINAICTDINDMWSYAPDHSASSFTDAMSKIHEIISSVNAIIAIWPDCPLDYLQRHYDSLLCIDGMMPTIIDGHGPDENPTFEWVRNNVPVASFFNMLARAETQEKPNYSYRTPVQDFARTFSDTMNMIATCLSNDVEVPLPDRWRIDEFHDTVMAEHWKIKNPNTALPQFLLPEPITVHHDDNKWTFFQPRDTHQLSEWGRAVRNCVGNGYYADGIKNKKHFIVLAMLNNKPVFTVQLSKTDTSCSALTVDQIKATSNQSLSSAQEQAYSTVFQECLAVRASQLTPVEEPQAEPEFALA